MYNGTAIVSQKICFFFVDSTDMVILPPRMKQYFKHIAKRILTTLGIHVTQNQRYDAQALQIMDAAITANTNCIDVGAHKGELFFEMIKRAPKGQHFAFEPIPYLFTALDKQFHRDKIHVLPYALSDAPGETSFQHVVSNPAYSGIRKRSYKHDEDIKEITVRKERLDDVLPSDYRIGFMKIDVEGAEYEVIAGAVEHLQRDRPVLIFEHGLGASEHYGTTPEALYDLLTEQCHLRVYLLNAYIQKSEPLTKAQFCEQFYQKLNYYFVAA
jgi:FkbM family methyltransferase